VLSSVPRTGLPVDGSVEDRLFRRALGCFPAGVCVVTAVEDGLDHAMTASAFSSVSLDPLLVLVCVETRARFHEAVLRTGEWAVSILDATAEPAARWLATRGRPLDGQLDPVPHHRGAVTGAPLLDQAGAWLECRTHALHPAGDHTIVVGEVLGIAVREGEPGALVHHRGSYRLLTEG
jgi:flavin reductase